MSAGDLELIERLEREYRDAAPTVRLAGETAQNAQARYQKLFWKQHAQVVAMEQAHYRLGLPYEESRRRLDRLETKEAQENGKGAGP
jgi:hypothetical protein